MSLSFYPQWGGLLYMNDLIETWRKRRQRRAIIDKTILWIVFFLVIEILIYYGMSFSYVGE